MHGLVLGKFMPPHQGHCYLIDFARHFADSLTVVVGSLAAEPIPGELRYLWMKELFPQVEVLHLQDENPQYPEEHPDFWEIWKASLERVITRPVDYLFASEAYGEKLAEVLRARFIPSNHSRSLIPISGTEIRRAPLKHWEFLPPVVRPHFAKRVLVFGPESTGKTTLSRQLAEEFGGAWVPEYARSYLEGREDSFTLSDMEIIARGQWASEEATLRQGKPLVVLDTDPLTTKLWSQELFGEVPESVELLAQQGLYDLTLLLDVDVPWVEDLQRYRPHRRREFYDMCVEALESAGRNYRVVRGNWNERWDLARESVKNLLI